MPPEPEPRPVLDEGRRLWSSISGLSRKSQKSHKSFRSYTTSSFEADDERSPSDETMSRRSSQSDGRRPGLPSYSGHDARPTSRKELAGWYTYGFAAETYVVCGIGSFIPIMLETLARENGHLLSDPSRKCGHSDSQAKDDGPCVLYIMGIQINTASFAMYTFSLSVLVQALIVVSISCAADHGNYRKKLLLAFAWIGSASVMGYIFVDKSTYILGAVLTIISNTCFGASFVLLNSFLPLLVRYHPELIGTHTTPAPDLSASRVDSQPPEDSRNDVDAEMASSASALLGEGHEDLSLQRSMTLQELTSKELSLSTKISAQGIGIGYSAALLVQCISIGILVALNNTTWAQRLVLFFIGLWWAVFTIPAALWLRPRPGPPLKHDGLKRRFAGLAYLFYAWRSLFNTMKVARRLVDIMLFLGGWFLLSDAIATTSSTAILFAKTSLHMKPWALGLVNVITTMTGVLGAFGWQSFSKWAGIKPHQTILVCIGLFELIPLYGLMGYLPFVQRWGVFGLQQPWEMYPLAAVYGLTLGGLSGYCRSLYGELIPPGSEAAFYALYAITDKGSSIFGPTIVGAIIDRTGSIRPAFWFLAALVGLPAPLIWFIDVERGKREGAKVAGKIDSLEITYEVGFDNDNPIASYQDEEIAGPSGSAVTR